MGFSNTEEFKKKYIEIETEMQKGNFREYRYNSAFETAPVICQYIKSEELGSRNQQKYSNKGKSEKYNSLNEYA